MSSATGASQACLHNATSKLLREKKKFSLILKSTASEYGSFVGPFKMPLTHPRNSDAQTDTGATILTDL
jgi:hypothetical protein